MSGQNESAAPRARPLDAARALATGIRDRAEHIERHRRLPAELVHTLAEAGLFRLCVPQTFGGGEVDPCTMVQVIEEIAMADGSAGWCVMIGATSGLLSAYLPEATAREIYAEAPHAVTGGVFAPFGTATAVADGYRVTGRWPFASGCEHCAWLMGGSVVLDGGQPRLLPSGQPDSRMLLFPSTAAEIIDTWTVSGLRGTGSHDIAVADVFVPESRSASLITDRPRQPGPLYLFPVFGLLALGIAAVALGVARSAIDELVQLAGAKTPTGSRKRLAERAVIQTHVAEGEALLRSARAFLFDAIGDAWRAAQSAGAISLAQRAVLRLAATHAVSSTAKVVDLMYNAGGGTSVYATSPLQRHFRDIHVVTQHMMVASPTYEVTGRLFLGIDTDTSML
jgi:alkylation response protein AidB-like acyl-CoA dehydrogenase